MLRPRQKVKHDPYALTNLVEHLRSKKHCTKAVRLDDDMWQTFWTLVETLFVSTTRLAGLTRIVTIPVPDQIGFVAPHGRRSCSHKGRTRSAMAKQITYLLTRFGKSVRDKKKWKGRKEKERNNNGHWHRPPGLSPKVLRFASKAKRFKSIESIPRTSTVESNRYEGVGM